MTSLDEKSDVGVHERNRHCDSGTIWKDKPRVLSETLDHGEDIIPAAAVETSGVVA